MGILSWLKAVTAAGGSGEAAAARPLSFDAEEEQFHGLDMRAALDAHINWTKRLQGQLEGTSNEELEVGTVASDHDCLLGKWIHSEAKARFGDLEEYRELRRVHAEFHLTAGDVLNKVQNGIVTDADQALKEVRLQSGRVQIALVRLYASSQAAA